MTDDNRHYTDVYGTQRKGFFKFKCSCGFVSDPILGRYETECQGDEHVELVHEQETSGVGYPD